MDCQTNQYTKECTYEQLYRSYHTSIYTNLQIQRTIPLHHLHSPNRFHDLYIRPHRNRTVGFAEYWRMHAASDGKHQKQTTGKFTITPTQLYSVIYLIELVSFYVVWLINYPIPLAEERQKNVEHKDTFAHIKYFNSQRAVGVSYSCESSAASLNI